MSAEPSKPIELGKYRLMRRLAVGGMAQIWLAVQRGPHGFEKVAVLKLILPELCTNDEFVQMFLDEARLAAGLDHSNVVRIYDFGAIGGQYYIAMEHLPGEDLTSIAQAHRKAQKPLPLEVVCDVIIGAATGLHFAHELPDASGRLLNVVHRDVSPSNIIVTYHGTVKLVDFGIARAETNVIKTAAGTLKGKMAYVSPEQAAGDPIDRRSDIFALGTVLYELSTQVRPFKRESDLATLQAVVNAPIAPPRSIRPDMPVELERIIMKALERPVASRYQTAAELADDLSSLLVSRGYVRSERNLAAYMAETFDEERRLSKMRVGQPGEIATPVPVRLGKDSATPSLQSLSPLRSKPLATDAVDSLVPAIEPKPAAEAQTTVEPSQLAVYRRNRTALIALGLVCVFFIAVGGTVLLWPAEPQPQASARAESPATKKEPEVKAAPEKHDPEVKDTAGKGVPVVPVKDVPAVKDPVAKDPNPPGKELPKAKGRLTLDTSPWSEVFLRGKKLGDTPLVDYSLPPGIHVLTLVNEGKGIKGQIEVEIQAGKTTVKKLKL